MRLGELPKLRLFYCQLGVDASRGDGLMMGIRTTVHGDERNKVIMGRYNVLYVKTLRLLIK